MQFCQTILLNHIFFSLKHPDTNIVSPLRILGFLLKYMSFLGKPMETPMEKPLWKFPYGRKVRSPKHHFFTWPGG